MYGPIWCTSIPLYKQFNFVLLHWWSNHISEMLPLWLVLKPIFKSKPVFPIQSLAAYSVDPVMFIWPHHTQLKNIRPHNNAVFASGPVLSERWNKLFFLCKSCHGFSLAPDNTIFIHNWNIFISLVTNWDSSTRVIQRQIEWRFNVSKQCVTHCSLPYYRFARGAF